MRPLRQLLYQVVCLVTVQVTTSAATDYHRPELEAKKLQAWETSTGSALETAQQKSGIRFIASNESSRLPLVTSGEIAIPSVLDVVGSYSGKTWHMAYTPNCYVLAPNPPKAKELFFSGNRLITSPYADKGHDSLDELIASFSDAQWQLLDSQKQLSYQDLAPKQRTTLLSALQSFALEASDIGKDPEPITPSADAFRGNVYFWEVYEGKMLAFRWPTKVAREPDFPVLRIQLTLVEGKRVSARSLLPKMPVPVKPPSVEVVSYKDRDEYQSRIETSVTTWYELVVEMQKRVDASYALMGYWLEKPIPFQVRGRSVAEIMNSMAAVLGADWKQVSGVWILLPRKEN